MVTTESSLTTVPAAKRADPLGRVLFVLATLSLALAPTQLMLTLGAVVAPLAQKGMPHHHLFEKLANALGTPIHPALLMLVLASLVWAVRCIKERESAPAPPLSHWLMAIAAVLGLFALGGDTLQRSVLKETAQFVFYLLIGVTVFRTAFATPRRLRAAVIALVLTTTLGVVLALVQRWQLGWQYQPDPTKRQVFEQFTPRAYLTAELPNQVCSTFATWNEHGYHPSRTAYAGFLALVLPFAIVLFVTERRRRLFIIWIVLLFLGAAVSVLAGYLMPAILCGILLTGFALGQRWGGWALAGVVTYLLLLNMLNGPNRTEMLLEPFHGRISAQEAAFRYPDEPVQHMKKFWGEQQAALNVIRGHPLLGVGAGKYQEHIGQSYDRLGEIDVQRLDPDAQNGYLVAAVNGGLIGLAALLALFLNALLLAWRTLKADPANPWVAAMVGAMGALILMTLATNPWVRGTTVMIIALLAMIGNAATQAPAERIDQ